MTQVADLSFLFDEKILKLYVKLLIYSHLAPFGQMDYEDDIFLKPSRL